MAKKSKEKAKSSAEYAEFKYSGENFDYSGRIYPAKKDGNPFIYLTLNETLTIQCHLVEGKKDNLFISWPSYKFKDEYKSFIYADPVMNEELDELIKVMSEALEEIE